MQMKISELKSSEKKILLFDIETAPNLGYIWGKYEQDVIAFKEHWYIISFAWKWMGEKNSYVKALNDFKGYKVGEANDKELVKLLWSLFNQADIIIAHNGNSFDIRKANARFLKHNLQPPSPYKSIDTLLIARRYFKMDSNKLDDLGDYFGIGRKLQTGGFQLWLGCIAGEKKSWTKMKSYNKHDVILLEKVYMRLRSWNTTHPDLNLIYNTINNCPVCRSKKIIADKVIRTKTTRWQSYKCLECGAFHKDRIIKSDNWEKVTK